MIRRSIGPAFFYAPGDSGGTELAGEEQGASGSGGASSSKGQNSGVAQQGPDGNVEQSPKVAELERQLAETQENISRLQSTYDQKLNQTEQRYQDQLREERQRRREAELEGLDDMDRMAHELQWAKEDNQRLQRQLEEQRQREETRQVADQWADQVISLGADPRDIDRSDPQATLDSSLNKLLELAAQNREVQEEPTNQNRTQQTVEEEEDNEPTPPSVVTNQGGRTDTGPTTPGEVVRAFNEQRRGGRDDWTWSDIKQAARRGAVDKSLIENVIRSRAETLGEGQ